MLESSLAIARCDGCAYKLQHIQKLEIYKGLRTFPPCVQDLFRLCFNGMKSVPKQNLQSSYYPDRKTNRRFR